MKDRNEQQKPQDVDPHLDIPSEANREKHINFLDEEDNNNNRGSQEHDRFVEERRKEWQKGLSAGRNEDQ
ncbi:MAG TPA: hypothetical protein VGB46_02630 [Flavisolibacter sp.]|jgi:hypothetical protein